MVYEWHYFHVAGRARNVTLTRASKGAFLQIDASDKPIETMRPLESESDDGSLPSERAARLERIDAQ
eukprot:2493396-Pleurochrysis_carterae.AAC.1